MKDYEIMVINFFKFLFTLFKGIIKGYRFLRISPNIKGRIFFYDCKKKNFIKVISRGKIDSVTANQIYLNHEYDLESLKKKNEINRVYSDILLRDKSPLIIDCGGNIGLSSKYFASEYPESNVVCIEPDQNNIITANNNCDKLTNIEILHSAIGSSSGFVKITNPDSDPNAFRVDYSNDNDGIKVKTINEILIDNPYSDLFIVKVDIEGFEDDLFKKNIEWIDKCPVLFVELHDWLFPGKVYSKNFINAISNKDRDFIYKNETIISIKNY